jgi:hypothetical protein
VKESRTLATSSSTAVYGPPNMNSLLSQPSPPRQNKTRGGVVDGLRPSRGSNRGSRKRRGGGSRLASSKPINSSDLSPSSTPGPTNGEDETATDFESSDEFEGARFERFNNTDLGNQYEQVLPLISELSFPSSRSYVRRSESEPLRMVL